MDNEKNIKSKRLSIVTNIIISLVLTFLVFITISILK